MVEEGFPEAREKAILNAQVFFSAQRLSHLLLFHCLSKPQNQAEIHCGQVLQQSTHQDQIKCVKILLGEAPMKGNGGGSRERLEELSEHLVSLTLSDE